jgi:hypothetical protein
MVVMKMFLGMPVPEPLRMKAVATNSGLAVYADKQADEAASSLGG